MTRFVCSRGQRFEGEDLAARQQRRVDREERVLRCRPDEHDDAVLHVRQQHVLLAAVEAVDLVEEEDRFVSLLFQQFAGFGEDFAHLLEVRGDGVERLEPPLRLGGNDVRQRRLPTPRRAVEDQRADAVGQQHAPEQLPRPEEVLLPDVLVEGTRPHPRGQRTGGEAVVGAEAAEEVHPSIFGAAVGACKLRGIVGDGSFRAGCVSSVRTKDGAYASGSVGPAHFFGSGKPVRSTDTALRNSSSDLAASMSALVTLTISFAGNLGTA